jgi:two-component system, OmpR family, phosphate regulon sensor histidine kinase PhoR
LTRHPQAAVLVAMATAISVGAAASVMQGRGMGQSILLAIIAGIVAGGAFVVFRLDAPEPDSQAAPAPAGTPPPPAPANGPPLLLEAVLGSMFDGVLVVDSRQRVLYLNTTARELLDLGDRPVAGRLLSEASRSLPLQELIERTISANERQQTEFVLARQKLTVAVSAGAFSMDPEPAILIVLHDVTELRRLERMRRDFVSNVSHELKTPLTSIQAYADTLLDGGLSDVEHNRVFVQRIVEQTERLRILIMDLLRLARIEDDQITIELGAVDLRELARDCVRDRVALATTKQVSLEVDLGDDPVHVRAETEGLCSIIENLIDNSINYTPAGGSVRVEVATRDGEACLTVADTGVGIPREHQQRVFERFYRVDRARSRAVGGTGLGLAIVKHLTQAFGGRVELESELDRGSTFRVWLPLANHGNSDADARFRP